MNISDFFVSYPLLDLSPDMSIEPFWRRSDNLFPDSFYYELLKKERFRRKHFLMKVYPWISFEQIPTETYEEYYKCLKIHYLGTGKTCILSSERWHESSLMQIPGKAVRSRSNYFKFMPIGLKNGWYMCLDEPVL
jgi:hypothetical protein